MWVKLQLNLFLNEIKSKRIRLEQDVEAKLASLEASEAIGEELLYQAYDEVYSSAVGEGQDRRREIVTTALRWVLSSYRELTLRELAFATCVRPDGPTFAVGIQESTIMEFCSNLIVEDSVGLVRFGHLSVRHYLEHRIPPDFDKDLAHLQAALTCMSFMKYHGYDGIENGARELIPGLHGDISLTRSFHAYIRHHWSRHCREAAEAKNTPEKEQLISDLNFVGHNNLHNTSTASGTKSNFGSPQIFSTLIEDIRWPQGYSVAIQQYVARGGDLHVKNSHGSSLLHETVRFRQGNTLRILVDSGAPLDVRDARGNTPLHVAAMRRFDQGAQVLLMAGANKNAQNLTGETPLHLAMAFDAQDVADTLLSANADGLAKNYNDDTVLHYAAVMGNSVFVESLMLTGYNPDGRNKNGDSAITVAINERHLPVMQVLLRHDAVLRPKDITNAMRAGPEFTEAIRQFQNLPDKRTEDVSNETELDAVYKVAFPDSGAQAVACQYCDIARWISGSQRGTSYRHHASISQLFASANSGCPLCQCFRTDLEEKVQNGIVDHHYRVGLTVTLEPSITQGSKPDRRDKISLSAGDTVLLTYELCLDRSRSYVSWQPNCFKYVNGLQDPRNGKSTPREPPLADRKNNPRASNYGG